MTTIYLVGNSIVDYDSFPVRMKSRLEKEFSGINFQEIDPSENMPEDETLNIIDTVVGINRVEIISNIDHFVTGKVYSVHDFDLGFTLKLMKKAGKLKNVKIFGVPMHMDDETAFSQLVKQIGSCFLKTVKTNKKTVKKKSSRALK